MAKSRYVQIRVSEDEEKWIDELAADYTMDRSKLILLALNYIDKQRPSFVIEPRGKGLALAGLLT